MVIKNRFRRQNSNSADPGKKNRLNEQDGFSIVELLVVAIILLILSAMAIPAILSSMRMARLRGAASDYSGVLSLARIYAIRDNRYYSTYILAASGSTPIGQVYIDMLPKSATGASGNGGTSIAAGDPQITMSSEIVQKASTSAPNTNNLKSQLLPATTPVAPTDTSTTAATFGPRGLPCTPINLTGGSVCDSSGGPTAFWTFLENTNSTTWQAVTITPAGRIQKWYYSGSVWIKL